MASLMFMILSFYVYDVSYSCLITVFRSNQRIPATYSYAPPITRSITITDVDVQPSQLT